MGGEKFLMRFVSQTRKKSFVEINFGKVYNHLGLYFLGVRSCKQKTWVINAEFGL